MARNRSYSAGAFEKERGASFDEYFYGIASDIQVGDHHGPTSSDQVGLLGPSGGRSDYQADMRSNYFSRYPPQPKAIPSPNGFYSDDDYGSEDAQKLRSWLSSFLFDEASAVTTAYMNRVFWALHQEGYHELFRIFPETQVLPDIIENHLAQRANQLLTEMSAMSGNHKRTEDYHRKRCDEILLPRLVEIIEGQQATLEFVRNQVRYLKAGASDLAIE